MSSLQGLLWTKIMVSGGKTFVDIDLRRGGWLGLNNKWRLCRDGHRMNQWSVGTGLKNMVIIEVVVGWC